jgi:sulfur-oxidizing protein SoxB
MQLDDGSVIDAAKSYKVAGWWDVVADYLRREDTVRIEKLNTPKLKNVSGNPGMA